MSPLNVDPMLPQPPKGGPENLPSWHRLAVLAEQRVGKPIEPEPGRFEKYSGRIGPVFIDYSKQRIDAEVMAALIDLAVESDLPAAIEALFNGAHVNTTEDRPALHTALRAPDGEGPEAVAHLVETERARFLQFAEDVRSGHWRGHTGKAIRTVVHIGIGGSHLGPALVCQALAPDADPEIRFLANIDGDAATRTLAGLDPATTLFIVVSKSFTTLETQTNAATARSWFIERTCDPDAIPQHFVAVTANDAAAEEFGLPAANRFAMWDWVGGRYSLWSSVGLPIAIALGRVGFEELLAGAYQVDRHFRTAALRRNLPVLLALLQVWNTNFLGAATHAVLPYDRRLRLLPDYLQQLEMESNGKSVHHDGSRVGTHTAPVVWGGEETNGQHAFHQLLHQGTRAFSADFVATVRPGHDLEHHHRWLLANCLAQSQALTQGRSLDELSGDPLAAHRQVAGCRPSTTILLDALTAQATGALLALYEHKTFCAGAMWRANSFDQWGVELGKALAEPVFKQLAGARVAVLGQHFSSVGLLHETDRIQRE